MNHHHEIKSTLSFEEKLIKLLDHWLKHNEDHSQTYKDWAEKAKDKNLEKVVVLIRDASDMTLEINKKFEEAIKLIKG